MSFKYKNSWIFRRSLPDVFLRKGILKIRSKFTGEHPCQSVISIKLHCKFINIALRHGCSFVSLLYVFRIHFPKNTSGWLLLDVWPCIVKLFNIYIFIFRNFDNPIDLKLQIFKLHSIQRRFYFVPFGTTWASRFLYFTLWESDLFESKDNVISNAYPFQLHRMYP